VHTLAMGIDHPLRQFQDGCMIGQGPSARPVPLASTRISVSVRGGLATVTMSRTFRNAEERSIEATITFPVPVEATLTGLVARIGGRVLKAVAAAKDAARETYERAVDEGRTAILHEEALRGIHILSVGHVPPGAEITVESRHVQALSFVDGTPRLRIPTTVGDIYGHSPLIDSDDLVHAGVVHEADLEVACDNGIVRLSGGELVDGRIRLSLDRPIDLLVANWAPRGLTGTAADGAKVTISVAPAPASDAALNLDILADRSGSMQGTKFETLRAGLDAAISRLTPRDAIRLWQFDDRIELVGQGSGATARELVRCLTPPGGGTEIGSALTHVTRAGGRDVVVITDGKSYALDVQALARTGCRFTVVLIGEDSLDAGIGYLASLTGGQIFIAPNTASDAAVVAALNSVRTPHTRAEALVAAPTRFETDRAGARILVTWEQADGKRTVDDVGAFAAGLVLPMMPEETAVGWAKAHGLVSHLTSLVLVDESGQPQEGLPATRKVPLMSPHASVSMCMDLAARVADPIQASPGRPSARMDPLADISQPGATGGLKHRLLLRLALTLHEIDWDEDADFLSRGDLTGLDAHLVQAIDKVALSAVLQSLAKQLGISPAALVVALLACRASGRSRAARRVFRTLVPEEFRGSAEALARQLDVSPSRPQQPTRFWGSVEIDMIRPVKFFDTILNAVVMELQRTPGAKVTLTLDIAAEAPAGFPDGDVSVIRDNARQLKFKAESTGFGD
jgi:hypothetical protein